MFTSKRIAALLALIIVIAMTAPLALADTGTLETGFSHLSDEDYQAQFETEDAFGELIRIGYDGGLCQAAIPIAQEKGFFAAEGLNTALTRGGDSARDALVGGKIDTSAGMIAEWLKAVTNGVDIVFTVGLHTGCASVITLADADISSFADAKEKNITNVGIAGAIGGTYHNIAYRFVAHENADLKAVDFNWKAFDAANLLLALQNKDVDIAVLSDQLAQGWVDEGLVKRIHSLSTDPDFIAESCCVMGIQGDFLRANPITSEKIARAVYKAALWIGESQANKEEAAQILLDNGHISGTIDYALKLMNYYTWGVGNELAAKSLEDAVIEYKELGVLAPDVDADELQSQIWQAFDLERE
ncbi:MAG: ABC transporter substrate-binding protein [Oscillospiraceae bacterium]|jgi:NitT/TauT family transport system substrate-binding protein|nr:ABC transporter substrate-binding protein [Oscillospiraceae bacterium]